uniref:TUBB7 n=1 Tax=Arundo donax TaxID=35708 RepID=A0A0A9E0C8_ARUDO
MARSARSPWCRARGPLARRAGRTGPRWPRCSRR